MFCWPEPAEIIGKAHLPMIQLYFSTPDSGYTLTTKFTIAGYNVVLNYPESFSLHYRFPAFRA
jgi:hypothetical protein